MSLASSVEVPKLRQERHQLTSFVTCDAMSMEGELQRGDNSIEMMRFNLKWRFFPKLGQSKEASCGYRHLQCDEHGVGVRETAYLDQRLIPRLCGGAAPRSCLLRCSADQKAKKCICERRVVRGEGERTFLGDAVRKGGEEQG